MSTVDLNNLDQLTNDELRSICADNKLTTVGNKDTLISRIQDFFATSAETGMADTVITDPIAATVSDSVVVTEEIQGEEAQVVINVDTPFAVRVTPINGVSVVLGHIGVPAEGLLILDPEHPVLRFSNYLNTVPVSV